MLIISYSVKLIVFMSPAFMVLKGSFTITPRLSVSTVTISGVNTGLIGDAPLTPTIIILQTPAGKGDTWNQTTPSLVLGSTVTL